MNAPSPAMSHFVCDLMTLGHGELAAATADVYEHASGAETCAPRACSMRRIGDGIWDAHFTMLRIRRFDDRDLRLVGTHARHYHRGKRGDLGAAAARSPQPADGDHCPPHRPAAK
ncbi:MAG TPA: hypothetical protein VKF32_04865, partial [Thermoanaerobaculia bacterium]|nr:hypothetical protein [Thermoanaerobaculia bacterium]